MSFVRLVDVCFGDVEGHITHFDIATHFAASFTVLLMVLYGVSRGVYRAFVLLQASWA